MDVYSEEPTKELTLIAHDLLFNNKVVHKTENFEKQKAGIIPAFLFRFVQHNMNYVV